MAKDGIAKMEERFIEKMHKFRSLQEGGSGVKEELDIYTREALQVYKSNTGNLACGGKLHSNV
ncbi:hypothetical protein THC_0281 [Caldimicrobium thiodismutans]|uniref:Uncharacterized protein n=1 Tax=Caldimicrobium thiodismutans TaxID=1653476 RepID=A0A0U5AF98_9BACT|nr:hypothetical protein [Caldimicrobium thiodismutans]BAU22679.1 hypothetical protein THC_0281 [Caldimicrobium thiodismutans]